MRCILTVICGETHTHTVLNSGAAELGGVSVALQYQEDDQRLPLIHLKFNGAEVHLRLSLC